MPVSGTFSNTGLQVLPDLGLLQYNRVTFSSLYKTRMAGNVTPDSAKRTIKYTGYTLYVEGIVTGEGVSDMGNNMDYLRKSLEVSGASLFYSLKGFGKFSVNAPGGQKDVAWGPFPKVLEFSPLGGNQAAYVRWQVEVKFNESNPVAAAVGGTGGIQTVGAGPVLEFTWESQIRYDARGYSSLRINGTLEIPITRTSAASRTIDATVDDFRQRWLDVPIDLTTFKVVDRSFEYSRDKRTCNFNFQADELPPMGIPPGCTAARGTMSVRNTPSPRGDAGKLTMTSWQISLRCTYTVRGDQDQRVAFLAFYSLLWWRMQQSRFAVLPTLNTRTAADQQSGRGAANFRGQGAQVIAQAGAAMAALNAAGIPEQQADDAVALWQILSQAATIVQGNQQTPNNSIILTDFGLDEGLYEDSDTMTFHATWWLATNLQSLLVATGFQNWFPGTAGRKDSLYAQSVKSVMGWTSWLENRLNPGADVIVDVGGGVPWGG